MEKLYNNQQNLIGYNSSDIIWQSDKIRTQMFKKAVIDAVTKLDALGVSRVDSIEYLIPLVLKYKPNGIQVINNSIYFNNCDCKWEPIPRNCAGLFSGMHAESIDLSALDTSKAITMENMFRYNSSENINIETLDTSSCTEMWNMFCNCGLKKIDCRSFDTSNVTGMTAMFYLCEAEEIDLSTFNTSKTRAMRYMFSGVKLEKLDLTSFDTTSLTLAARMFSKSSIGELDLSSFRAYSIESCSDIFRDSHIGIIYVNSSFYNYLSHVLPTTGMSREDFEKIVKIVDN